MLTPTQFPYFLFLLIFLTLPIQIISVCENRCNGRGTCEQFDRCDCFTDAKGKELYVNYDCSEMSCPRGYAWVSTMAVKANDMHPWVECKNFNNNYYYLYVILILIINVIFSLLNIIRF
jgi:hypothetical protein